MKNNLKIHPHETLQIGIILSLVGGILDAHTFIFRNGVFANTQTGNIVFLALFLNTHKTQRTIQCILSMVAFMFGILLTELIKKKIENRYKLNYICIILTIEMIFLAVISTIPKNVNNTTVIVVVSFVCAIQTNAFRSLKGSPYATTMCTGNLRSACSSLYFYIFEKDKKKGKVCFSYLIIIAAFFIGVLLGRFLTFEIKQGTILVCSFLLFAAILIIVFQGNLKKHKNTRT